MSVRDVFYVVFNGERSGRVIRYNKKTKEAKVVMDNLRCNNGLALNKDRSFVISCESSTGLVHRYWIKGPKAGTRDIFAKVPGYPDNIRLTPTGDFWLGIHCKKNLIGRLIVNNQLSALTSMVVCCFVLCDGLSWASSRTGPVLIF